MGGGDTNYPVQPTYGEGMADAMKAQMEMLTGTGDDFSQIYEEALGRGGGSLRDVLRQFEAPLRQEAAQIDTDVLRQTLLGGEIVADEKGRVVTGEEMTQEAEDAAAELIKAREARSDLQEKREQTMALIEKLNAGSKGTTEAIALKKAQRQLAEWDKGLDPLDSEINELSRTVKLGTTPVYSEEGEYEPGEVIRTGAGMLDLFGPGEAGMVTRERTQADIDALPPGVKRKTYEGYVDQDEKLLANYQRHLANDPTLTKAQFGEEHFKQHGRREGRRLPEGMRLGEAMQVERRAGFDPVTDEFLGLTTLGADVSEQLARRQRAADIYDVEQLGGQATEAYRQQGVRYDPVTGEAIEGTGIAGALATARELGPGGTGPSAYREDPLGTFAGMGSRDPMRVALAQGAGDDEQAQAGQFIGPQQPQVAADTIPINSINQYGKVGRQRAQPGQGLGDQMGTQPTGTELLRGTMLAQAQEGLGQGLTERERRNLREASRARATAMGRTFDPTATIDELKIQMLEDEGRRARNLAQAQAVLGGEVGIQQTDLERELRHAHMGEQLRQAGLGQERAAATQMVGLEQAAGPDIFQAVLGRGSGAGAAMGQQMFGQAGYGLQSGPQYLNPEAGLGYISQAAANEASMWGAGQMADASRFAGLMGGLGALGGGLGGGLIARSCWVAREVYGLHNPAWIAFRYWMLNESPSWFRALYIGYGERFAKFISDKPRLKARIRSWMDTKIGRA